MNEIIDLRIVGGSINRDTYFKKAQDAMIAYNVLTGMGLECELTFKRTQEQRALKATVKANDKPQVKAIAPKAATKATTVIATTQAHKEVKPEAPKPPKSEFDVDADFDIDDDIDIELNDLANLLASKEENQAKNSIEKIEKPKPSEKSPAYYATSGKEVLKSEINRNNAIENITVNDKATPPKKDCSLEGPGIEDRLISDEKSQEVKQPKAENSVIENNLPENATAKQKSEYYKESVKSLCEFYETETGKPANVKVESSLNTLVKKDKISPTLISFAIKRCNQEGIQRIKHIVDFTRFLKKSGCTSNNEARSILESEDGKKFIDSLINKNAADNEKDAMANKELDKTLARILAESCNKEG